MDLKTCPSCGADVPAAASRCKECFHDFDEPTSKARSGGPIWILGALAIMAAVAGGVFWYRAQVPTDQRILVDGPTRTVQWVTEFPDGSLKTDRVSFDDVRAIEYSISAVNGYEIIAVTNSGDRKVIEANPDKALHLKAEKYAELMEKPLTTVDSTRSFLE